MPRWSWLGVVLALALLVGSPGVPKAATALTKQDLDTWLDGYMPYAIASGDIAGAVVVVVKDGKVLTERGYGYADVAAQTPVDPEKTVFRQGSISKLFTWTAVMQLYEQGKLDLDKDVNGYLDFSIPPKDGLPITLRQLMTHSAGFEDELKGLAAKDVDHLPSLAKAVKSEVPARIFAPGKVIAYSNYGASLAGYIVERVSGEPFASYVQAHILSPLAMSASSFAQPLPEPLNARLSKGYMLGSGRPFPFEAVSLSPAGAFSTTGDDIAKFMIAALSGGRYQDAQILKPETLAIMQATALQPWAPFNGMALGFYHEDKNGRAIVGHGGDTQVFHTDLHLFLGEKTGLYIGMNSQGRGGAAGQVRSELLRGFTDRYFPASPAPILPSVPDDQARKDARAVAGAYVSTRRGQTSFLKLIAVLGELKVTALGDGTLTVNLLKTEGGALKHWREVSPLLWQEVGGTSQFMAKAEDGKIIAVNDDSIPVFDYQRATGDFSPITLTLFFCAVGIFIIRALAWPLSQALRWRGRPDLPLRGRPATGRRLGLLSVALVLLSLAGWALVFSTLQTSIASLNGSIDPILSAVKLLTFLSVIGGTALAGINSYWVLGTSTRGWAAKLGSLIMLLAFLYLSWFVIAFDLVSPNLRF